MKNDINILNIMRIVFINNYYYRLFYLIKYHVYTFHILSLSLCVFFSFPFKNTKKIKHEYTLDLVLNYSRLFSLLFFVVAFFFVLTNIYSYMLIKFIYFYIRIQCYGYQDKWILFDCENETWLINDQ